MDEKDDYLKKIFGHSWSSKKQLNWIKELERTLTENLVHDAHFINEEFIIIS